MHYGTVAKDHDVGKKKETIVANTIDHMEFASKRRWLLKTPTYHNVGEKNEIVAANNEAVG